jgi:phosphate:Na+ symporter
MPLSLLEGALGGIGLFLLGMRIMSDGIRTVADERIRSVFAAITSNRFYSMLFGIFLSLSLNSVSAAVIFSIGLLNGGVLNAFQSLSVLGGVLIGASIALHLPVFPYHLVATPLVFVGVLLKFFARRRRIANAGDLLLGAGLLFLGLTLLENSFKPFESHPFYNIFNGAFFNNPLLATVFGWMLSCFVQSSTSLAAVITSLFSSYDVSAEMASIMVLGGVVGVAFIGCLASIGGTSTSRRIAISFFCINLFVILSLILCMHYFLDMDQVWDLADHSSDLNIEGALFASLAWMYTVAALFSALFSIVLSGVVARIIGVNDLHGINGALPQPCAGYLDSRILNTPTLAIEQARKEIVRMTSVTMYMYADTREILFDFDARRADTIRQHEQVLDSLNHEITSFLASLANSNNKQDIGFAIPGLLQNVTDLEHIGDRCEDILDYIVARKEANIFFSDEAMNDLKRLSTEVNASLACVEEVVVGGVEYNNASIRELKKSARVVFDDIKRMHFNRISNGNCIPRAAILYNDMTTAFEKIAELSWNIMSSQDRKPK